MLTPCKFIRNIIYFFHHVKEVEEVGDKIIYKCLKCGTTLTGFKFYGKLRINCACGNAANVYTGENRHIIKSIWTPPKKQPDEFDKAATKYELFKKHIDADLMHLYNTICDKKGIVEQAHTKQALKLTKDVDKKKGFEVILEFLNKMCGLERVPINLVYEPLRDRPSLSTSENSAQILGTTYFLSLGGVPYYTIYISPSILDDFGRTVATIAHELSHVFASHNKISFISPDSDRGDLEYNEQMTDLLAITLGMGDLMCSTSGDNVLSAGGYLSDRMVHESYDRWRRDFLSGVNQNIKTLISCNECNQKMKVPIRKGTLQVTCSRCNNIFLYDSGKE